MYVIHHVRHSLGRRRRSVRKDAHRAAPRLAGARGARGAARGTLRLYLRQSLEDAGLPIDEGALYPLLRRLETQGLLTSEWREDAKRTKRFYRLSPVGVETLAQLLGEWNSISESILRLTEKDK